MSRKPPSSGPADKEPYYPNLDYFEVANLPGSKDREIARAVRAVYAFAKVADRVMEPTDLKWLDRAKRVMQIATPPEDAGPLADLLNGKVKECATVNEHGVAVDVKKIAQNKDLSRHMGRIASEMGRKSPDILM